MKTKFVALGCLLSLSMGLMASESSCESSEKHLNPIGSWVTESRDLHGTSHQFDEKILTKENVEDLTLIWSRQGPSVQGVPNVFGHTVYYGDFAGNLFAVKAKTGALVWENSRIAVSIPGALSLDNQAVYVPTLQESGISTLVAVDRKTGQKVLFNSALEGDDPVPLLETGSIVVHDCCVNLVMIGDDSGQESTLPPYTFRGGLYAFDANTGQLIWKYLFTTADNITEGAGDAASFCVAVDKERGFVYVGTGNAYTNPPGNSCSLFCLNYRTKNPNGELVWKHQFTPNGVFSKEFPFGLDFDVGQVPNLFTIKQGHDKSERDVVGVSDKSAHYYVLDRDTGELIWSQALIPAGQTPGIAGSPTGCISDSLIYVPANYDPDNLLTGPIILNPFDDGNLQTILRGLTVDYRNTITALRQKDGKIVWQRTFTGAIFGSISFANGVVYVPFFDGHLRALDGESGHVLFTFRTPLASIIPINIPLNTNVAISNGRLFVGGGFNFLPGGIFAFGLPSKECKKTKD
jgi:polyvinyl alcohol dehydrogenase (cytochrome)